MSPDSPRAAMTTSAGTAASLSAAYDAFADMVAVLHGNADQAGGLTAAFVTAAAAAADGRDAVAVAPSIPAEEPEPQPARSCGVSATAIADEVAQQARLLSAHLAIATPAASQSGDRDALAAASRHADTVYACLTGTG